MDRLSRLKDEAGTSRESALDSSVVLSEGYITAEESKYFTLSEEDTTFNISPIKDVPLASAVVPDKSISNNDQLISNLSPIPNKNDLLDSYKFGKQIEAANILSGGVDIFEDNDNSFDGNELVIDDNVEVDYKSNSDLKVTDNSDLQYQKSEDIPDALDNVTAIASKDTEVVLQIGGKNVQAIEIGNGLYLYRKDGEEELAAVQVITGDDDQPTFKFLKVRENADLKLEVYEEIQIEVPKETPAKEGKSSEQTTSQLSVKDINKAINKPASGICADVSNETKTITSSAELEENKTTPENMSEINLNAKIRKYNETRKSPVIHSTPNKEGIPLTKTMVDMQLHSNRHLDNLKTIEVCIENSKNKASDVQTKSISIGNDSDQKLINSKLEGQTELVPKKNEDLDNIAMSNVDEKEALTFKTNTTQIVNKTSCDKQIDVIKSDITNKSVSLNPKPAIENSNDKKSSDIVTEDAIQVDASNIGGTTLNEKVDVLKVDEKKSTNVTFDNDKNMNKDISNFVSSTAKGDQSETKSSEPDSKTIDVPGTSNVIKHSESVHCENTVNILGVSKGSDKSGSDEDKTELVMDLDANKKESVENCLTKNDDKMKDESNNFIKKIEENCESTVSKKELSTNIKSLSEDLKEVEKPKEYLVNDFNSCNVKHVDKKNSTSRKDESSCILPGPKNTKEIIDKKIESAVEAKPVTELKYCKSKESFDLPLKIGEIKNESVSRNPSESFRNSETVINKQSTLKEDMKNDFKYQQADKTETQDKLPMKTEVSKLSTQKSSNNHNAVPFGKWTEANRQEFLNKIKEAKVPVTYSNTKSIKQANDLNRRDVLQKIDSQRQSNAASAKAQEIPQSNIKPVQVSFAKNPTVDGMSKVPIKVQKLNPTDKQIVLKNIKKSDTHKTQIPTLETDKTAEKKESSQRKEINNQDLIDKTIEGIINRAVAVKPHEGKHNEIKETVKSIHKETLESKLSGNQPDIDAIEMKMNELHGIPFVERPVHQLPKIHNHDVKTYSKAENTKSAPGKDTKIPKLLPFVSQPKPALKATAIDLDSEDEVIEHEPITGDIDLRKKNIEKMANIPNTSLNQQKVDPIKEDQCIITENDFDKFARRNSITYDENCLTVNFECNKESNLTKSVVQKPVEVRRLKSLIPQKKTYMIETSSKLVPVNEGSLNKNLPSKVQMAYNALTAKRKIESPITIIEDKPVKVVFMESNPSISVSPLNVQGKELVQKPIAEPDSVTIGTCDTISSDMLDATDEKSTDETKIKTKHQRKQVLTPVEAPEPELIAPRDLDAEVSSKKKRKTEEIKPVKSLKNLVPKKSYLLGRNVVDDSQPQNLTKNTHKDVGEEVTAPSHLHAPSAIDNLVKAAELLETQSTTMQSNAYVANLETESITPASQAPAKRGRGRPRKNPLPDNVTANNKTPSPQKKPRLLDNIQKKRSSTTDEDDSSSDEIVKENWTMGKINENIICPICNKLFRSENVVFKHVKHCSGPSPNRSESDKRSPRRSRFSLESDSKSMESKPDDMETGIDQTEKSLVSKKRKSKCGSSESKDDVIVIEDTPVKSKPERNEPKLHESRKLIKTKAHYKNSSLSCEYCGKSFRQLSYLVNHKLLHKKENTKASEIINKEKSVFSCEVCRKEFRKLHHLVQHRQIHNPNITPVKTRISSSDQNDKLGKAQDIKLDDDQSAGFRCEPCDKSFRKLHHLVEHRETHDGINRQKSVVTNQGIIDKPTTVPPPQCDICKKTFRKLHHLIEHKEQHNETSSEKSDDKSVKSSLSAKDIIHECSLCYMVFPNEHSLTKHSFICQKKKKQSALKQTTAGDVNKTGETNVVHPESENKTNENRISINNDAIEDVSKIPDEKPLLTEEKLIPFVQGDISEFKEKLSATDVVQKGEDLIPITKTDIEPVNILDGKCSKINSEISLKKNKMDEMPEKQDSKNKFVLRKNSLNKEKQHCKVLEAQTSNLSQTRIKNTTVVESSDDDEVRYMMNPDYKADSVEAKSFMKVRAKKRNSLQIERPKSKDLVKRSMSLQNPSKVARSKSKDVDVVPNKKKQANTRTSLSSDSEDNDVKYSFPKNVIKENVAEKSFKDKRKSLTGKRKNLTLKNKSPIGVAKRKSVISKLKEEPDSPAVKVIKRRQPAAEHRCDCGELFSSAALLARHASLAHTPPRVRKRRAPDSTSTNISTTVTTRRLVDKSRK